MIRVLGRRARKRTLESVYQLLKIGVQEDELDPFSVFVEEVRSGRWLVFCLFHDGGPVAVRVNDISPLVSTGIAVSLFTVIDEGWIKRGLFGSLIGAANERLLRMKPGFLGVMAEMDTSDYGVPAATRLEIFRRVGYQEIGLGFQYVFPPLVDGGKPNATLVPVFLPQPGVKTLAGEKLAAVIRIYFSWVDEFKDPTGCRIRDEMISRMALMDTIPLVPL